MVAEVRKNWRDVGATLDQLIAAGPAATAATLTTGPAVVSALPRLDDVPPSGMLPRGRLLRCGRVDFCTMEELGAPAAIVNLRIDADEFPPGMLEAAGTVAIHCPAENKVEKYDTSQHCVRLWIADVLRHLEQPAHFPVLVHCKHGRDRTGIIIAALLAILDVPVPVVRAEYALAEDCRPDLFELTLAGFGLVAPASSSSVSDGKKGRPKPFIQPATPSDAFRSYIRGLVDVDTIRRNLLHMPPTSAS